MGTRDLPGYGDPETWSPAALASLRVLDEMQDEQPPTKDDIFEAVQEAKDWMDTYFAAVSAGNLPRARQARAKAQEIMQSLEVVKS